MNLTIDLKNYSSESTVFKRTAVRGIIRKGKLYLMIFSKYGDYKFPGGGMEEGEALEETLVREVQEETGFRVIKSSIEEYGTVLERRKGVYEDLLEMLSHYYFCDVEDEAVSRNLDEYEKEYDYRIVWLRLQDAIERNKLMTDLENCPWVVRDTKVMELLAEEQFI